MILIADCGSTKIDWCLLNNKDILARFNTTGMNAVMLTEEEMSLRLANELLPEIEKYKDEISGVFFYGAGCIAPSVCNAVSRAIDANIPAAGKIEVYPTLWPPPAPSAATSPALPPSWARARTHASSTARK